MSALNSAVSATEPDRNWLYRLGGISALAIGTGYIIIIALFVPLGAKPSGAEAWLAYIAGNTAQWWAILGLSVLTDILFIPVALALYQALKGIHKNAMLLAVACVSLFVVLDLAVTWTNYAVLIALSASFSTAANEAQKAAAIAAALYPAAVVDSSLLFVYNTLTLSVGILITGYVMLKGIFNKVTAYVGLATGILGVIAVVSSWFTSALGIATILASVLTTLWVFLVSARLIRFR